MIQENTNLKGMKKLYKPIEEKIGIQGYLG